MRTIADACPRCRLPLLYGPILDAMLEAERRGLRVHRLHKAVPLEDCDAAYVGCAFNDETSCPRCCAPIVVEMNEGNKPPV